ncbi:hypothetical protein OIU78_013125 [Salix suchowensis]|nr:hypothetical protein OIU78_013125 [Salix suchowensis]
MTFQRDVNSRGHLFMTFQKDLISGGHLLMTFQRDVSSGGLFDETSDGRGWSSAVATATREL